MVSVLVLLKLAPPEKIVWADQEWYGLASAVGKFAVVRWKMTLARLKCYSNWNHKLFSVFDYACN